MPVIPDTRRGKIEFYGEHLDAWAAAAGEIGVTPAQVAGLAERVAAARAALLAQQEAAIAARAATAAYNLAVAALHADGMTLVGAIRQTAAAAGVSGGAAAAGEVYVTAQLPLPAARRPLPPPGRPRAVRATLLADGALRLTWKCQNPHGAMGTMYEIRRRVDALGDGRATGERIAAFVQLGTVGVKHFTDTTLPAGAGHATYSIRAIRSTHVGPEELLSVNLGVPRLRVAQSA